jgi:hypothetical protein
VSTNEYCRVCGYQPHGEPPYDAEGYGSQEICPCCGVQWGYQDSLPSAARRFREVWLARGAPWRMPEFRPPDWDLTEQLSPVPEAYR